MTTKTKTLPKKPSALLSLALGDFDKVKRRKGYQIDMGAWHSYQDYGDICEVCLAGAVMACSLGEVRTNSCHPKSLLESPRRQLLALDWLREGHVASAFYRLEMPFPSAKLPADVAVAEYEANPVQWRRDMSKLVKRLQEAGY